ncbi:MAG: HD-GYP domain-containing protein [Planctomycetota bacterium]
MSTPRNLAQALEASLTAFTLYPVGHGRQKITLDRLAETISSLTADNKPLPIGLASDTLVVKGIPYFEETPLASRFIKRLQSVGVQSLRFHPGVLPDDLRTFVLILSGRSTQHPDADLFTEILSAGVRSIEVQNVPLTETFRSVSDIDRHFTSPLASSVRTRIASALAATLDTVASGGFLNVEKLEAVATDVVDNLLTDRETMIAVTSSAYHDHYTYNHSVNTCVLATTLASTFIKDTSDLSRIAQAALLHDIGKVCIPEEVLYKPGTLDDVEWQIMRNHPSRGAEILLRCRQIDPLSVLVAYGHHVCFDGTGYPPGPFAAREHIAVGIVQLVDVYEAMTSHRPYRNPIPLDRSIAHIVESAGRQFHPRAVEALVHTLGFYPPGSTLELADRSLARVLEATPDRPLAPRVSLYRDGAGKPIDPPSVFILDAGSCPPEHKPVHCTQTDPPLTLESPGDTISRGSKGRFLLRRKHVPPQTNPNSPAASSSECSPVPLSQTLSAVEGRESSRPFSIPHSAFPIPHSPSPRPSPSVVPSRDCGRTKEGPSSLAPSLRTTLPPTAYHFSKRTRPAPVGSRHPVIPSIFGLFQPAPNSPIDAASIPAYIPPMKGYPPMPPPRRKLLPQFKRHS